MPNDFDLGSYLQYHVNNFLETPEGMDIMDKVLGDDKHAKARLNYQLSVHRQVMDSMDQAQNQPALAPDQNNPQVALGDETPLMPQPPAPAAEAPIVPQRINPYKDENLQPPGQHPNSYFKLA